MVGHSASHGSHDSPTTSAAAPTDLHEVLQDVIHMLAPRLDGRRIQLTLELSGRLPVAGERRLWWKTIYGLLDNALQETPHGGELAVTTVTNEDGSVELEVADEGAGAAETLRYRLSEAAPVARRDLLAEASRYTRMQGGRLEAMNCPQGGIALMLRIPRAAD